MAWNNPAALLVAGLLGLTPAPALAADFYFEFFNSSTSQTQSSYPFGVPLEIIVASKTQDVTKLLPIAIVIRADNNRYRNAIPNNPEQFCRGPDGCSIPGPDIKSADYLEVLAINSAGETLASYTKGTPPPAEEGSPTPAPTPIPTTVIEQTSPIPTPDKLVSPPPPPPANLPIANAVALGAGAAVVVFGGIWLGQRALHSKNSPPPKPCQGSQTVIGTGSIAFNAPWRDEFDQDHVITGLDDLATAFIEAYKTAHAHAIAQDRARADAMAKCNEICEQCGGCSPGFYCGGEVGSGKFPEPINKFDPKNPPASVKRVKQEPTIGPAPVRGGTIQPDKPGGYRFLYTISGEFNCACLCQPGFWERLKREWGKLGSGGGHTGPTRPPVH